MKREKGKILFVSHDANYTGAPLTLYHMLEHYKKNCEIEFDVLIKKDGLLKKQFESLGKIYLYPISLQKRIERILKKIRLFIIFDRIHRYQLKQKLKGNNYSAIYFNSVSCGELLSFLSCDKIILHVHELEHVAASYMNSYLAVIKNKVSKYICSSKSVACFINSKYEISYDHILTNKYFLFPEFEQVHGIMPASKVKLGIPNDSFIVGASGTAEWRKGTDLFVQIACRLLSENPDAKIYFVWIGKIDKGYLKTLQYDTNKLGIKDKVIFTGEIKKPIEYYKLFDVFLLTSREEAFGIVALENALLGNPVFAFESIGDFPDVIKKYDIGIVAPYLDVNFMKRQILIQYRNRNFVIPESTKENLKKEYSVKVQAEIIFNELKKII